VASDTLSSKGMEGALQGPRGGKKRTIHGLADVESQKSSDFTKELTCEDFGWVSSWRFTSSSAKHGGRALLQYLQAHPDEGRLIHVVL
jgi:hypothetical protein